MNNEEIVSKFTNIELNALSNIIKHFTIQKTKYVIYLYDTICTFSEGARLFKTKGAAKSALTKNIKYLLCRFNNNFEYNVCEIIKKDEQQSENIDKLINISINNISHKKINAVSKELADMLIKEKIFRIVEIK